MRSMGWSAKEYRLRTRWKQRRDETIRLVYETGLFSHRFLGDVFDLAHSAIGRILKKEGAKQATPAPPDLPPTARDRAPAAPRFRPE